MSERLARSRGTGFTLTEVLVVISILILLTAVLMPTLSEVREAAYDAICRSNLHNLSTGLTTQGADRGGKVPGSTQWVSSVSELGLTDSLICPKDQFDPHQTAASLDEVYVLQFHTGQKENYDISYVNSLLEGGGPVVDDPQIWCRYPGGGVNDDPKGENWPPGSIPDLDDNQAFIGIDNDACCLITLGDRVEIESLPPPDPGHSRHWVMKGDGDIKTPLEGGEDPANEDNENILHLYGWDYTEVDPRSPASPSSIRSVSYGMNGLIGGREWNPSQIVLIDALEASIEIDAEGNFITPLREVLAPRHWEDSMNMVDMSGAALPIDFADFEQRLEEPGFRWFP